MSQLAESVASPSGQMPGVEDPFDARLMALYRAATPEQKLKVVMQMNQTLQGLKASQLAVTHPDWTAVERQAELRRWWLSARD